MLNLQQLSLKFLHLVAEVLVVVLGLVMEAAAVVVLVVYFRC